MEKLKSARIRFCVDLKVVSCFKRSGFTVGISHSVDPCKDLSAVPYLPPLEEVSLNAFFFLIITVHFAEDHLVAVVVLAVALDVEGGLQKLKKKAKCKVSSFSGGETDGIFNDLPAQERPRRCPGN